AAQTSAEAEKRRGDLRRYAITAYQTGNDSPEFDALITNDSSTGVQKRTYLQSISGSRQDLVDALNAARQKAEEDGVRLKVAEAATSAKAAEIEQLKKRFEKKPEHLLGEMSKLYKKHDCSPLDLPTLVGSFIQLPIFGILYSSIKSSMSANNAFLWIRSLVSPDFYLTLLILTLTGCAAYLMPSSSEQIKSTLIIIQVVVTFFIVWKLAAGLGLYWASSSLVGLFQTFWLRYYYDSGSRVS
ncbi:MAG: YidC/Oxa1 family membrane protein insertase, partial [Verrucomicrobiota bacterium]